MRLVNRLPVHGDAISNLLDIKFDGIVRQKNDYSCGAAAIATILRFSYYQVVDEDLILFEIMKDKSFSEARTVLGEGVSLLDLKKVSRRFGVKAEGVKVSLSQISLVPVPFIARIRDDAGSNHFVVVKSISSTSVEMADSARGLVVTTAGDFASQWADGADEALVLMFDK
ncbi:MAG: hypothetical protein HQL38_00090 [Alphaproteobacteria bacterium]|nr:hypothetical protein [Alphaproteobacteria bacterium]